MNRRFLISLAFALFLLTLGMVQASRARVKTGTLPQADPTSTPEDEMLFEEWEYITKLPTTWRYVTESALDSKGNQSQVWYNHSSVTKTPQGIVRTWVKFEHGNSVARAKESSSIQLEEFDCNNERTRIISITDYDKYGQLTFSESRSNNSWAYVVPDTLDNAVYRIMCRGGFDPAEGNMRNAAEFFMYGRQAEKRGEYQSALTWYEKTQEFLVYADSKNEKTRAAIARVKARLSRR